MQQQQKKTLMKQLHGMLLMLTVKFTRLLQQKNKSEKYWLPPKLATRVRGGTYFATEYRLLSNLPRKQLVTNTQECHLFGKGWMLVVVAVVKRCDA